MRARRRVRAALVLVALALASTGCTHALSQPMPAASGKLAVAVTREQPSKGSDMPLGVHQIPDSSTYVSGHQGAAPAVGMLFGLIGVAAAHAAAQSTGEKKTEAAAAQLRIDVAEMAERVVAQAMAQRPDDERLTLEAAGPGGRVELAPFLLMNFVGNDQVRPWVALRAAIKDAKGAEKWRTRYFACVDDLRPLGGPDGWAPGEGTSLRAAVESALRAAVEVFLKDVDGGLQRGKGQAATVKGQWPWVKQPLAIPAEIVAEMDELLVVVPKVSDVVVFAGVTIVPRTLVEVLPPP